jgi:hypothetical protein
MRRTDSCMQMAPIWSVFLCRTKPIPACGALHMEKKPYGASSCMETKVRDMRPQTGMEGVFAGRFEANCELFFKILCSQSEESWKNWWGNCSDK